MADSLLPPSASALERRLAAACADLAELPVPLRDLFNPYACPAWMLPYLAWARSVDRWDERWPEETRRRVVADAFYVHAHKGVISALRRVVEPFGYLLEVIEWWQSGAEPGTFRLKISVQDQGITEETFNELERLIAGAKPLSRPMTGLDISLQTGGAFFVGAGCYLGDQLTVYPYFPETIVAGGTEYAGAAVHVIDTVRLSDGS